MCNNKECAGISYIPLVRLSEEYHKLIAHAYKAAESAYAPYSKFRVGAAVLLSNGEVVAASNQENSAFPSGACAEQTAINYSMSSYPHFAVTAVAVVSPDASDYVFPCGSCRQLMSEVIKRQKRDFDVIVESDEMCAVVLASALLPMSFTAK